MKTAEHRRLMPIKKYDTWNGLHPRNVTGVNGLVFRYSYRKSQHYWLIVLIARYHDPATKELKSSSYFIHDLGLREAWDRAVRYLEHSAGEFFEDKYLEEAYARFKKHYLSRVNEEHKQYAEL